MNIKNKILLVLFGVLYASIAFVSTYHAIAFFGLSNPVWLGAILAITFEVGQAAVLFSLLTSVEKKAVMPWVLMCILTAVQILGNVFSTYKYMMINNMDQIEYFTKSVLFFMQNPNPEYNYVMIAYITGAILPVVALCMTGMVVKMLRDIKAEKAAVETPAEEEDDEVPVHIPPKEEPKKRAKRGKQTKMIFD